MSGVSVQDIISEQRFLVRDTATQKYLWSDAEMVYALNESLRQIGMRNPIWDDSGDFNITTVAAQSRYFYDSCILMIESITRASDDKELLKVTYRYMDRTSTDTWRDDNTGYPDKYIENTQDRSIVLVPIPATDYLDTLYLNVWRTFKSNYDTTNMSSTFISDLDMDLYRFPLLMGMQMYLYRKADSNTYREDLAQYAEFKFLELIGKPVDMRTLEARRENANKDLHYIPHPYASRVRYNRKYLDRFDVDEW